MTGVTFNTGMKSSVPLDPNNKNDYYIVEFPKPTFADIPNSITCVAGFTCYLLTSHNWVVAKPNSAIAANSLQTFTLTGATQA